LYKASDVSGDALAFNKGSTAVAVSLTSSFSRRNWERQAIVVVLNFNVIVDINLGRAPLGILIGV
jgi:hypothetical protein